MIRTQSRRRAAFTLVEVLLVVAILGFIAAFAVKNLGGAADKARKGTAKAQMKDIESAADLFEQDTGRYPSSLNELVQNAGIQGWDGPYLKGGKIPKDPWKNDYTLTASPDGVEIRSGGKGGANPISTKDP